MKFLKVVIYMNDCFQDVEIMPSIEQLNAFMQEKSAFEVNKIDGFVRFFSFREGDDLYECFVSQSTVDLGLRIVLNNDGTLAGIQSRFSIDYKLVNKEEVLENNVVGQPSVLNC
jgi:hypothetical protein